MSTETNKCSDYLKKSEYQQGRVEDFKGHKKDRHELIGKIQVFINDADKKMDEHNTKIALLDQSQKTMLKEFQEHKQETKEGFQEQKKETNDWFKEIKNLIISQNETYATKEEHKINSTRINSLFKIWIFIWSIVWAAIIWAIINLIIIQW